MNHSHQSFGLKQTTPPAIEPVTLQEAKLNLRVDFNEDDSLITNIIAEARAYVEQVTRRQLITATWTLYHSFRWPPEIILPRPPLVSVASIKYTDGSGVTQPLEESEYKVTTANEPAVVRPTYQHYWPEILPELDSICVEYQAGYGAAASSVPRPLYRAIHLMIAHLYDRREPTISGTIINTVPMAFKSLVSPFIVRWSW